MPRTIRVFWPNQTSGWRNFNWTGVITGSSVVHIVACEGRFIDQTFTALAGIERFRGDATMYVKNIHPHDDGGGGVEFFLQIDWSSPLNIVTDITVFDAPEQGVRL